MQVVPRPGNRYNMAMFDKPPLSLSLAGLAADPAAPWAGGPRGAIAWAAEAGFRSVQLDATAAGVRPRELDRSARRDLAAFLRRSQLTFSGLDLWIPPEHFNDPSRSDRALAATIGAMEMASEVAVLVAGSPAPVVSLWIPEAMDAEIGSVLTARAEATGTRIADHSVGAEDARPTDPDAPLAWGVDPAALLLAGRDPALAVSRAGPLLASARLSDATTTGRAVPGEPGSRLDQLAYLVALSTVGYARPLVVDLRGLAAQDSAAARLIAAWTR